ncbi:TIGR03111 family XrtG-associated glycosyltransferase [Anaerocolumna xylanovorans]|uniref:Putative glycosyltransferase, exosortase G-associated n=1 Tax=Anaerocolumna xylanovorans DSM 12503 TaxID=1121345 RepID=A0A1M7YC82_9FIRM|nr:TIGR03111 family XrtG-associated glycosyltransferase [Anaerocolumna xylanovorans]SHO50235.1 putative glycosyltransferase, exosortase G-associated [Anaerocolumna xylanovorans DSM 12503]
MQNILQILAAKINSWLPWVIIPLMVEVLPAIFGFFILVTKKIRKKKDSELKYYPQITIIIPVYNSAGSLKSCLDSVYYSSYPCDKVEIFLANNGSRDESFTIFQDYQNSHADINIKWLNAKQGKSKALNMALFNSEGKYIIHIDSDGTLQKDAIRNLVTRFENEEDIHCMTGTILTNPEMIKDSKGFWHRLMQKVEFYEYAQAFLAGRNFESEFNSIFTLSGAFSAFRKSTILKTQLYNTETVCEDTHVTFQVRRLLKKRIDLCEKAVFFVDPIDSMKTLYVQRQRWQRGEIEVAHMFPASKGRKDSLLFRLLLFDHTFAFPRMIWYFALICLTFLDYPFRFIIISLCFLYFLYILSGFLYYLNIISYLTWNKELRNFYSRKAYVIFLMPAFNFIVYWFRLAGIINSIKGASNWRTKTLAEENKIIKDIIRDDIAIIKKKIEMQKKYIYRKEER